VLLYIFNTNPLHALNSRILIALFQLKGMSQAMRFQAVLVLVAVLFADATSLQPEKKSSICPTGFANFGDSLTDTGNSLDAFPLFQNVENPPYGESFFGAPAKRYSDGRLVPDFFCILSYLSSSLNFVPPNILTPMCAYIGRVCID
jgi:hypothetical protein